MTRTPLLAALALALPAAVSAAPQYSVVASISGPDGGWDLLSVDPLHHRAYVARGDAVMAVDLATNVVTGALLPAQRGHAALSIPGSDEAIVTNGSSNNAQIFDGRTGVVRATIAVGKKPDAARPSSRPSRSVVRSSLARPTGTGCCSSMSRTRTTSR